MPDSEEEFLRMLRAAFAEEAREHVQAMSAGLLQLEGRDTGEPRAAVVEVPLLFEAGLEGIYDATIAVVCDERLRSGRASARGHAFVDERAARQLSQEEKARRATYVVRNDGSEQDLEAELSSVLGKLGR